MNLTKPSFANRRLISILTTTLCCLLVSSATLLAAPPSEDKPIYIVRLTDQPGAADRSAQMATQHKAIHSYQHVFHGFAAQLSDAALQALQRNPNVQQIEKAHTVYANFDLYPSGVDRIDADLVHPGQQGLGARVAIVDTGIDFYHPDLAGQVDVNLSRTFIRRGKSTANGLDDHGHGTHVAGTVAAVLGNGLGAVGVAPQASLVALKVLNRNGSGYSSDIIAALDYITGYNNSQSNYADIIHVANFSLGGSGSDTDSSYRRAFARTVASGCFIAVAAGNESDDAANHLPAAYDMVFTVSAMDPVNNTFAYFSNYGSDVDITAPGVAIYSTLLGGGYATWNGTSMATPHVAGAAALYVGQNLYALDKASAETSIRNALIDSGESIVLPGDPDGTSEPLVDAEALLGPVVPLAPAIQITVSSDKSSYQSSDVLALLTMQVRDEYGDSAPGLVGSNFDLGSYDGYRRTFNSTSDGYTIGLDISSFFIDTDYPVIVTVTSGELQDSDNVVIRKASTKTIYISDITYEKAFKSLRGYLTVRDLTGFTVAGAVINLTLKRDGSNYKSYSITTNGNGIADFRVGNAKRGSYTIIVNSVSSSGATYDPSLDVPDPGYNVP
jgi:subtilisin family serine protease